MNNRFLEAITLIATILQLCVSIPDDAPPPATGFEHAQPQALKVPVLEDNHE